MDLRGKSEREEMVTAIREAGCVSMVVDEEEGLRIVVYHLGLGELGAAPSLATKCHEEEREALAEAVELSRSLSAIWFLLLLSR